MRHSSPHTYGGSGREGGLLPSLYKLWGPLRSVRGRAVMLSEYTIPQAPLHQYLIRLHFTQRMHSVYSCPGHDLVPQD